MCVVVLFDYKIKTFFFLDFEDFSPKKMIRRFALLLLALRTISALAHTEEVKFNFFFYENLNEKKIEIFLPSSAITQIFVTVFARPLTIN